MRALLARRCDKRWFGRSLGAAAVLSPDTSAIADAGNCRGASLPCANGLAVPPLPALAV